MSKQSFLIGKKLIAALIDAEVLPYGTTRFEIKAALDEAVTMTFDVKGGTNLLDIVSGIETTDDPAEAIAH